LEGFSGKPELMWVNKHHTKCITDASWSFLFSQNPEQCDDAHATRFVLSSTYADANADRTQWTPSGMASSLQFKFLDQYPTTQNDSTTEWSRVETYAMMAHLIGAVPLGICLICFLARARQFTKTSASDWNPFHLNGYYVRFCMRMETNFFYKAFFHLLILLVIGMCLSAPLFNADVGVEIEIGDITLLWFIVVAFLGSIRVVETPVDIDQPRFLNMRFAILPLFFVGVNDVVGRRIPAAMIKEDWGSLAKYVKDKVNLSWVVKTSILKRRATLVLDDEKKNKGKSAKVVPEERLLQNSEEEPKPAPAEEPRKKKQTRKELEEELEAKKQKAAEDRKARVVYARAAGRGREFMRKASQILSKPGELVRQGSAKKHIRAGFQRMATGLFGTGNEAPPELGEAISWPSDQLIGQHDRTQKLQKDKQDAKSWLAFLK
jgi:hypothetical protein